MDYLDKLDDRSLSDAMVPGDDLPGFDDVFPVLDDLMEKAEVALDDLSGICSRMGLLTAMRSVRDVYDRVSRCREDYRRVREDIQRVV